MAINMVVNKNKSSKYIQYSKTEYKTITGDMAILVGCTNVESGKVKATPVPFTTEEEHKLYYWKDNSKSNTRISMPQNVQSLNSFFGSVRVYTKEGLILTIQAEKSQQVCVLRTENLLLIHVGDSTNKIMKDKRSKQLAQMGVWRA